MEGGRVEKKRVKLEKNNLKSNMLKQLIHIKVMLYVYRLFTDNESDLAQKFY